MSLVSRRPIRVKVSIGGAGPMARFSQFSNPSRRSLDNIEFRINDPHCDWADVWIVIERPEEYDRCCRVSADRLVFVGAETSYSPAYWQRYRNRRKYLDQFAEVHTWLPLKRSNRVRSLPYLPWMINANHGRSIYSEHGRDASFLSGVSLEKTADVSVFCSDKAFTVGHKRRLDFVRQLSLQMGDSLAWFGNGVNPLSEKWDGLAPFRYSVVIENQSMPDLITEKLYDAYLGLAMPIYFGAPNVTEYFPSDSLVAIDISNPEQAIATVREVVSSDLWRHRSDSIREARDLVLTRYNLVHRLGELSQRLKSRNGRVPEKVELHDLMPDPSWVKYGAMLRHRMKHRASS